MKRIVVGGIPNPIGGVTSFISRLVDNNLVSEIIDIYPSSNKSLSRYFTGEFTQLSGFLAFYIYFCKNFKKWDGKRIHFNFSRQYSLLFMFLLPKFGAIFELMLHHGELETGRLAWLYKFTLRKFTVIYVLSDLQEGFYKSLDTESSKIIRTTSYVKPLIKNYNVDLKIKNEINAFFTNSINIVASGCLADLYNHFWAYQFAINNENINLAIFLYGDDITPEKIESMGLSKHERVKVFQQVNQDSFNYVLSNADIYVRPALKDSFGIAVADAINLGIKVLASDVCERYPGANIFSPTNYKSFSHSLNDLIQGKDVNVQSMINFREFEYD